VEERVAHQFETGDVIDAVTAVLARRVVSRADAVATVPGAQGRRGDPELARYRGDAQPRHVEGSHFAIVRDGRGGRLRPEDVGRSGRTGRGAAHLIVGSPGDRGNSACARSGCEQPLARLLWSHPRSGGSFS